MLNPPDRERQLDRDSVSHGGTIFPEESLIDVAVGCAAALFAILWMQPFFSYSHFASDEGLTLQTAVRVLNGELPYRDFFSFFTPASYYFYALLFRVFGVSLLLGRVVLLGYAAFFSFATYMLARRASPRIASLVPVCMLAFVGLPSRFVSVHNWDSTAVALVALYAGVLFLESGATPWVFSCGFFGGLATMVEQSKGGGLMLGLAVAAIALYPSERDRWNGRHLCWFVAGAAIPTAVVVLYFGAHHALAPMIEQWTWPLHHYSVVNKLPYGYVQWSAGIREAAAAGSALQRIVMMAIVAPMILISVLPLLVLGTYAAALGKLLRRRQPVPPATKLVVLAGSALLGVMLGTLATGRPDFFRLIYLAPLFFFLLPLIMDARLVSLPTLVRLRPILALGLLVSFFLCGLLFRTSPTRATNLIETRRGLLKADKPDEVIPYVQAHVPAGTRMLVYPYFPLYSFLTATMTPVKYEFMMVGMHTPAQFDDAMNDLERDRTPVVLYDLTFRDIVMQAWPATPIEALAHDPMADFIFAHYRPCKTLAGVARPFEFMVRNDLPCPR